MGSDFYSPQQAARILSRSGKVITERRVRQMLQTGEIAGEKLPSGRWRVEQGAVHALLENRRERNNPMTDSQNSHFSTDRSTDQATPETYLSGSESVRELLSRVEALSRELGRSEARLELTERTESSIREERDQLRGDLEAEREERKRLQDQLERLRGSSAPSPPTVSTSAPATDTKEPLQDAKEASQAPEGGFERYGSGSDSPAPESGANAPLRVIRGLRGIASRIFGRG